MGPTYQVGETSGAGAATGVECSAVGVLAEAVKAGAAPSTDGATPFGEIARTSSSDTRFSNSSM